MATMGDGVYVHLLTRVDWRAALSAGSVAPASLVTDGFVHLSRPEQVALPADRLFAGRHDLLLLVVAPDRLADEVRFEPGAPDDPASMRFPHLFGPLPVAAVTSVVPYHRAVEGLPPPGDAPARARAFDRSVAERRAAAVFAVTGGFAAVDTRVAHSYEHNTLWLTGDVPAAAVVADADCALAGCAHRRAVFDGSPPPPDLGWEVDELRLMVLDVNAPVPEIPVGVTVVPVTGEVANRLWEPMWRRSLPDVGADVLEHLFRREAIADAHVRVVDLAVLGDDGAPLASAQLRIDGATAAVEAVMTAPDARRRGYGRAVLGDAIRRARAAGCDVVFLVAAADDWPRHWYARVGFVDAGARWEATRS
jgi:uncharacterized protein (DUF952 family)/GNAT superfamily N-acetyltransferase